MSAGPKRRESAETPRRDPRIVHLTEAAEVTPTLVRWFIDAWTPWYGPDGEGDAEQDLAACHSRDSLPICLVALGPDGEPLGTAALKSESAGSELGVGPWLAALLVGPVHRGRGVGTALIAAIEAEARRLGFPAIYVSTNVAEGLFRRRGWQPFATTSSLWGPVTVYRFPVSLSRVKSGS
ncbi:MAG: GNAT family N-acetyltransferase [Kiloniellales bacterium]